MHSDERNANKRVCLVHSIQKNPFTIADNERKSSLLSNICWLNNGNTRLLALCAGETCDEKLKINKLGLRMLVTVG